MGCCYSVSESNVAIIERFGRFSHVIHPGFNCVNCCTQKVAGELSFKIQQYNLDFNTRTKDNVFVTLKFAFMLKVSAYFSSSRTKFISEIIVSYLDPFTAFLAIFLAPLIKKKKTCFCSSSSLT